MATPKEIKQLLLKFKLSTNELKDAVREIRDALKVVSTEERQRFDEQKKQTRQATEDQKAVLIREKALQAELRTQLEQKKLLLVHERQLQEQARTRIANERATTAEIQRQTAELRRRQQEQARQAPTAPGGPAAGGIGAQLAGRALSNIAAGVGGGEAGALVAGVVGGGGILVAATLLLDKLRDISAFLVKMPLQAGALAESLTNMAARAGVTVKELQRIGLAAGTAGVSTEEMAYVLSRMNLQLTRASGEGISRAERVLRAYGITARDAATKQFKPLTEILLDLAELFEKGGLTQVEKGRIAFELFSRSGQRLIPVLNGGRQEMAAMFAEADRLAPKIGTELLKAQQAWNLEVGKFDLIWKSFIINTGGPLLKFFSLFLDEVNAIAESLSNLDKETEAESWERIVTTNISKALGKKVILTEAGRAAYQRMLEGQTPSGMYKPPTLFLGGAAPSGPTPSLSYYLRELAASDPKAAAEVLKKVADALKGTAGAIKEADAAAGKSKLDTLFSGSAIAEAARKVAELQESIDLQKILTGLDEYLDGLRKRFEQGLVSQQQYLATSKAIVDEEYQMRVDSARRLADIKQRALMTQVEEKGTKPEIVAQEAKAIQLELQKQLDDAQTQRRKKIQSYVDQEVQDKLKAEAIKADADYKASIQAAEVQQAVLQDSFDRQLISVQQFIEQKKALWVKEEVAFVANEERKYAAAAKTAQALEQKDAAIAAFHDKLLAEREKIDRSAEKLETDRIEKRFKLEVSIHQAQLDAVRAGVRGFPGRLPGGVQTEEEGIRNLITDYEKWIATLQHLAKTQQEGAEAQKETIDNILGIQKALRDLQTHLPTTMGRLASAFGMIGGAIGGGDIGGAFQRGGSIFAAQDLFTRQAPGMGVSTNPLIAMGQSLRDVFKDVKDGGKNFGKNLEKFASTLSAALPALLGFVSALTGQGGPAAAGLTGATSGAALGGALASAIGGMAGGAAMGAKAGPWGVVIGASIGLIAGIFAGAAAKAAERLAKSLSESFNKITTSLQQGTTKLVDAIAQAQALRQQALAQMTGKKEQKQLAQLLPQFDEAIAQMQAQQAAIFKQFEKNLDVLRAPEAYQQALQSVQSVIDKYQEYIDAGGSVIAANEYLVASFRKLKEEGFESMTSAEEEAIQNALSYNDLLTQRQDLLTETQQQINNLMFAGVPTRQQTRAQSIGAQISELQKQRDKQLHEIDMQISVARHRMEAEQTIFSLASTRINLENRLLELKFIEIDRDVARLTALKAIVDAYQSGGSINTLDMLLGLLGLPGSQRFSSGTGAAAAQRYGGGCPLSGAPVKLYGDPGWWRKSQLPCEDFIFVETATGRAGTFSRLDRKYTNRGLREATEWKVGDFMLTEDGTEQAVRVFDLHIPGGTIDSYEACQGHVYSAWGFIGHNKVEDDLSSAFEDRGRMALGDFSAQLT